MSAEREDTATAAAPHVRVPMPMSDSDFIALGRLIRARTGIVLNESKRWMLTLRLTRELRRLGLPDFPSYRRLLDRPGSEGAHRALTSAVTTNVTSFFRGPEQFAMLAALVLDLRRKADRGARVRLWSAGCSTGQEPASIAMTLLDRWPEAADADIRILATDIDEEVIGQAEKGLFDAARVRAEVPAAHQRHFLPAAEAGRLRLDPRVAATIRYRQLNLHDPWPFRGMFDVIFCRNVVIYFDSQSRRRLWQRLAGQLVPGGCLFVGHSERVDDSLRPLLRADGVTRYCRTGARFPDEAAAPGRNGDGHALPDDPATDAARSDTWR